MNFESETLLKLAEMAKEIGGQAWPILVKQQYITALTCLCVFGPVSLIGIIIGIVLTTTSRGDEDKLYGGWVLIGIFSLILAFTLLFNVPAVLFPEGEALKALIHRGH